MELCTETELEWLDDRSRRVKKNSTRGQRSVMDAHDGRAATVALVDARLTYKRG